MDHSFIRKVWDIYTFKNKKFRGIGNWEGGKRETLELEKEKPKFK